MHLFATLFAVMDPIYRRASNNTTPSLWDGAIAQRLGLTPSPNQSTAALLATARARCAPPPDGPTPHTNFASAGPGPLLCWRVAARRRL